MKFIKTLFLVLTMLVVVSCKDALNTRPSDFLTTDNYYQNESQLNNALNGVYDPLGQEAMYANGLLTYLSYGNDEGVWRASGQTTGPMVFNYDPTETNINNLWTALYYGINRANMLLENIDKADVAVKKKEVIKGQALFLRGYYYFMLADNWGGVPLKLNSTQTANEVDIPATPAKTVFEQVVRDMETAEGLLPRADEWGPNSAGRISKNTARGILARVYLTMAGAQVKEPKYYEDALKWSKLVIDDGKNALNDTYSDIFIRQCQDRYDVKESMWEVEFFGTRADAYAETGYVGNRNGIASNNIDFPGYGYAFLWATSKLYRSYETRGTGTAEFSPDERRDWVVAPYTWNDATKTKVVWANNAPDNHYSRYPGKWRRDLETNVPRNKNYSGINFPLLRYADVLLMYAEAENQLHGPANAYAAINQVRRRAYGKLRAGAVNPQEADLTPNLDKAKFFDAIVEERMRELAFECLRSHDLKRWGLYLETIRNFGADMTLNAPANRKFLSIIGTNIQERHLYYPIPSREISYNKLIVQNPGW